MKHNYKITDATKQELIDYLRLKKALKEYISFMQQAIDTENLDEKQALYENANNAFERYEEYSRQYDLTKKKLNKALEL